MDDRVRRVLEQLEAAPVLLSTLSVKEIAYAAGFRSQSHFVQAFKRAFGTRPRQYRATAGR